MPRASSSSPTPIPLRYYARSSAASSSGSGLDVLWPEALMLLGMGSAILWLAALRFRKRLD